MGLSCSSESCSILQSEELSKTPIRLCHGYFCIFHPLHDEAQFIDIPQGFSNLSHTNITCLLPPTNSSVLWTSFLFLLGLWRPLPLTPHLSIACLPSPSLCLADSNSFLMSCLTCPCFQEAFSGLDCSSLCTSTADRFEKRALIVPP